MSGIRTARPRPCAWVLGIAAWALACIAHDPAHAQRPSEDATQACGAAASRAEREWRLPTGLLAAIGIIESGRRAPNGIVPTIWPWTINAGGRGFYHPSKAAAVDMVRGLQRIGVSIIDVGCFQVDLFYHPYAFASLEEAFDPDANARAAARILSLGRLGSTGWDGAIAAYHSASPLLGVVYLQKVRAIWPWVRAHPPWGEPEPEAAYAVLLSPQARLVRVVTPDTAVAVSAQPAGMPRLVSAGGPDGIDRAGAAVAWLHPPAQPLPLVLSPIDARGRVPR
jgi:hypothetical protein